MLSRWLTSPSTLLSCISQCPHWSLPETYQSCLMPKDCVVSDWSSWGSCSKICSDPSVPQGSRSRSRQLIRLPTGGGSECPQLEESLACEPEGDGGAALRCVSTAEMLCSHYIIHLIIMYVFSSLENSLVACHAITDRKAKCNLYISLRHLNIFYTYMHAICDTNTVQKFSECQ